MALSKLKTEINEDTRRNINFDDLAAHHQSFKRLKVQGKNELEEIDFYSGSWIAKQEFMPSPSTVEREQKKQREKQMRCGIQLDELLKNFTEGHVCFVGPAGIGKTTLLKSIARDMFDKDGIEMVVFMRCRNYNRKKLLAIHDFFFASIAQLGEQERKMALGFAIAHPDKVVFILDSLDTLGYTADGVYEAIKVGDRACPEAILWNFLSGIIIPGCRIITSSREHSIRYYRGSACPQKVVALLGFTKETVEQVITGYLGLDGANHIMRHLEEKLPDMLALCNIPVVLVCTLTALRRMPDWDHILNPTTLTRVLIIVLQTIIRSPHRHQHNIPETVDKLAELSHKANVDGRVFFTSIDFEEVGLDPVTATDLAIFAPGGFQQKLFEGENILFFSHQMFQELLGAVWIARGSVTFLQQNVQSHINNRHFSVIRRFLYGILLDHEVHDAVYHDMLEDAEADERYEAKVDVLKQDLQIQLGNYLDKHDCLELLISTNEAKDGVHDVIEGFQMHDIVLASIPLSRSDVYAIGSALSQYNQLGQLDLQNCGFDGSSMKILSSALKESNMQLFFLCLSENTKLGIEGVAAAGEIVMQCDTCVLGLRDCKLTTAQIITLANSTKGAEMRCDLSECTRNATKEDVDAVASLLPNVCEALFLFGWQIKHEEQILLQKKLQELDGSLTVYLPQGICLSTRASTRSDTANDASTIHWHAHIDSWDKLMIRKIEENIRQPVSTEKVIDTDGGALHLRGCELKFPPKALDEKTAVSVTVRSHDSDAPENHVPISPALKCSTANVRFRGLVEIKLPIYYQIEDGEIVICKKTSKKSGWEEVQSAPTVQENAVIFKVSHFCWYKIFHKFCGVGTSRRLLLQNYIFYKSAPANLIGLTCIDDHASRENTLPDIEKDGYKRVLVLPSAIALGEGERLSYKLECTYPEESSISPEEVFLTYADFTGVKVDLVTFSLVPPPSPTTEMARIKYTLNRPNVESKTSVITLQWDAAGSGRRASRQLVTTEATENTRRRTSQVMTTNFVTDLEVSQCTEAVYRDHFSDDKVYPIYPGRRKGIALVVNNDFKESRAGSEVDFQNMVKLWRAFGFEVITRNNLTSHQMLSCCQEFADRAENSNVVVVIIMTHGNRDIGGREYLFGEDNEKVFVDDIVKIFTANRALNLRGVPKLFLFQACRGEKDDFQFDAGVIQETYPERSDMLLSFPTQLGFKALRHTTEGSWFMNAVTNVFMQHAHDTHVLDMFTMVNNEVSMKATHYRHIQMSTQENSLRKRLYLFPGWPKDSIV